MPDSRLTDHEQRVQDDCIKFARIISRMPDGEKDQLLLALLTKRRVDGLNGRDWDSHIHLEHEQLVQEILNRQ